MRYRFQNPLYYFHRLLLAQLNLNIHCKVVHPDINYQETLFFLLNNKLDIKKKGKLVEILLK